MNDQSVATERVIRVYVSSTFQDMHVEREELVKHTFPALRHLCSQRGVVWGEVDLRWGLTDENKAENKVLPICLEEIRRCRPFFIGILGERYGRIPDQIPDELIEREPWLSEHKNCSVTELEILYGALRNPQMAEHAFFYFRSPAYRGSLPPGPGSALRSQDDDSSNKLQLLKERIRKSSFPVREDYADPKSFGELVLADLTAVINKLYPEGPLPNPLDREAAEHEAFARSRTGVYVGRDRYFHALDQHAAGDGPPLVILGESGSGKSALLANWALRYRTANPNDLFLMHFIGATPASADWAAMVRRILGEFNRRLDLRIEIPAQPEELRAAFANALSVAAKRDRVVVVLDALNQLENRDQASGLVWLPAVVPANMRLIVSSLPGPALDELRRRAWPELNVEPLDLAERQHLIFQYFKQYTKALSAERARRIANAPQSANPLYLRALLEELRIRGEHEKLDWKIEHYLGAANADALYEKILTRYEEDYGRERPELARDAMSLLWAARRGLSEAELLDLLGSAGQPLPAALWAPLYLAAEQSLVSRSGLINFSHNSLRQAVEEKYLAQEAEQRGAHLRLANYFEAREGELRQVEELPWQLAKGKDWDRLANVLAKPSLFAADSGKDQLGVNVFWAQAESGSELRMNDLYRDLDPEGMREVDKHFGNIVRVFYGTDRERVDDAPKVTFSGDRSESESLHLGTCEVSIPQTHRTGKLETPRWFKFEFSYNPAKHVTLIDITACVENLFYELLWKSVQESDDKDAFVFVHGFNVSFEDAVRRTAQIAFDLDFHGAPILFSWPSCAEVKGYAMDEATIDWVLPHLSQFLHDIASRGQVHTLHLIAHSMGNRVLARVLKDFAISNASLHFTQVLMAAPDVDRGEFIQLAKNIKAVSERITLYASSKDKALQASQAFHGYPRAGDAGDDIVVTPEIDTIDASEVDTDFLAHSYFCEDRTLLNDIFYVVREGKPPQHRYGLVQKLWQPGIYWFFRR